MPTYAIYLTSGFGLLLVLFVFLFCLSLRRYQRVIAVNKRFIQTICDIYEQVYELNLTNNEFYQYFILNGMLKKTKMHEPLSDYLPRVTSEHVYQNDVAMIKDFLTIERLQSVSDEECNLKIEYRRLSPQGTPYWCMLMVQGLPKSRRQPAIVILYVCDINESKSKERQAHQNLKQALENAERLNEVKGNFTSCISHEIRTPLNAIMGYLRIARDHKNDPKHVVECLDKAEIASNHLLSLVNDILDVSAIENGKLSLGEHPFKLRDFIASLDKLYYEQASEAGIDFLITLKDITEENLVSDDMRLRQILLNLLNNAFKFTPKGGRVELIVCQNAIVNNVAHMSFTVADTGVGMREDFIKYIFNAYEQEDSATARKYGGSGLGLNIVKGLVEMMGGSVEVVSAIGKGSRFTVNLPIQSTPYEMPKGAQCRAIARLRILAVSDDRGTLEIISRLVHRLDMHCDTAISCFVAMDKIKKIAGEGGNYDLCLLDWDTQGQDGTKCCAQMRELLGDDLRIAALVGTNALNLSAHAAELTLWRVIQKPLNHSILLDFFAEIVSAQEEKSEPGVQKMDFSGHCVLLVEDNNLNREIGREVLKNVNLDVEVAVNGAEAVEMFTQKPEGTYQLILMDIQMPVMDGFAATRQIRACEHSDAQTIPIIALTANAYPSDVNKSLAAGMNAHASKPIDPDALYSILEKFLTIKQGV